MNDTHDWVQGDLDGGLAVCRDCGVTNNDEEQHRDCPGPRGFRPDPGDEYLP